MSFGDRERGAIGPFVIAIFLAMIGMASLVVDGGNAINARQRVSDNAEQAARRGADQIDEATLRSTGVVVIDQARAGAEARQFLYDLGYDPGEVYVVPGEDQVEVTVTYTVEAQLLSLVGFSEFTVTGEATARAAVGIIGEI